METKASASNAFNRAIASSGGEEDDEDEDDKDDDGHNRCIRSATILHTAIAASSEHRMVPLLLSVPICQSERVSRYSCRAAIRASWSPLASAWSSSSNIAASFFGAFFIATCICCC